MLKDMCLLAFPLTAVFACPALAQPPADIDACIKLSADTARAANVNSEQKYVKFHFKLMDLDAACGQRDFAGAEKISAEIKAAFPPDK